MKMYIDAESLVIRFFICLAIAFFLGFDFARWLARKHPEAWKKQLRTDEEVLRGLWSKIKGKIRR